MKRAAAFLLIMLAGCSTAPVADLMDWLKPGRLPSGPYHGGVCGPNGSPALAPTPESPPVVSPPPFPPTAPAPPPIPVAPPPGTAVMPR
jgi:hypothetical protein